MFSFEPKRVLESLHQSEIVSRWQINCVNGIVLQINELQCSAVATADLESAIYSIVPQHSVKQLKLSV